VEASRALVEHGTRTLAVVPDGFREAATEAGVTLEKELRELVERAADDRAEQRSEGTTGFSRWGNRVKFQL
jgi:hypothetical protein